jgi:hypothetical protein
VVEKDWKGKKEWLKDGESGREEKEYHPTQ